VTIFVKLKQAFLVLEVQVNATLLAAIKHKIKMSNVMTEMFRIQMDVINLAKLKLVFIVLDFQARAM